MSFWAEIPAIANLASGLFGKKKSGGDTVPAETLLPGFQTDSGKMLFDYIQKYLGQYQPGKEYGGDFVAGMSDSESTGMNRLNQFLGAPELGELFNTTKQGILDTVGGKYADPNTSPFIKSMINLSNMNLNDSINASRRGAGARGSYFSESAIRDENSLRERANVGLDTVVGNFVNQERDRQLKASPIAAALDQYENFDAPLAKIGASQQYGALPRMLAQAQLEAEYSDFNRKQDELSGVVGTAQNLFGTNTPQRPAYTNPIVQENNTLGNILGMISKLNLGAIGGKGDIWSKLAGVFGG